MSKSIDIQYYLSTYIYITIFIIEKIVHIKQLLPEIVANEQLGQNIAYYRCIKFIHICVITIDFLINDPIILFIKFTHSASIYL